jgi:hypothetical protein
MDGNNGRKLHFLCALAYFIFKTFMITMGENAKNKYQLVYFTL